MTKTTIVLTLILLIFLHSSGEDNNRNRRDQIQKARSLLKTKPLRSREIADSLLKNLKVEESPETVCDATLIKAGSYLYRNENLEALNILKNCGKIISEYHLRDQRMTYLKYLGTAYSKLSNYPKALESFHQFLSLAGKNGDKVEEGKAYNNIALVYIYMGNHEKALSNLYETLKIMEETGNKPFEAIVLNNIGICQTELKNYPQSLAFYSRSLKIKEELKDREGIGNALNNIGQSYFYMEDMPKALEYTKKAEKIAIEINSKKRIATAYTNMGRIYLNLNEMGRAEKYLRNSLRLKEELGDKWELIFTQKILAELYKKQGKINRSLKQAEMSLAHSREIGSEQLTSEILLLISGLYKEKKNFQKALDYYREYKETHDSLLTEKGRNRIEELKVSYEIEKMDNRIRFLEKENDLKNRDILSRKKIQRLFIALSILLFLIVILILLAYRTKLWANKELQGLNTVLEDRTSDLEKALEEVQTLTGLLPVCSSCKKVRDDQSHWKPMEEYIKEHSGASVTHSICPDCRRKSYPDKKS